MTSVYVRRKENSSVYTDEVMERLKAQREASLHLHGSFTGRRHDCPQCLWQERRKVVVSIVTTIERHLIG